MSKLALIILTEWLNKNMGFPIKDNISNLYQLTFLINLNKDSFIFRSNYIVDSAIDYEFMTLCDDKCSLLKLRIFYE